MYSDDASSKVPTGALLSLFSCSSSSSSSSLMALFFFFFLSVETPLVALRFCCCCCCCCWWWWWSPYLVSPFVVICLSRSVGRYAVHSVLSLPLFCLSCTNSTRGALACLCVSVCLCGGKEYFLLIKKRKKEERRRTALARALHH